jgi:hypothetical protein
VAGVIEEIREERPKKTQLGIRVFGHLISYAEHQFGDRIPGKSYRERGDGDRIDNWKVEIEILIPIYCNLLDVYSTDESLSMIDSGNLRFPYLEKMLDLLRLWSLKLDSNSTSQIDNLDKDQMNIVLLLLATTERNIGIILRQRNEFELAES